jgi:hypothetical protein
MLLKLKSAQIVLEKVWIGIEFNFDSVNLLVKDLTKFLGNQKIRKLIIFSRTIDPSGASIHPALGGTASSNACGSVTTASHPIPCISGKLDACRI